MIQNRRDLGGMKTKDGRTIRPGLLIRSAHLFRAEEQDLAGISAVIDLRTPGERAEAPDRTFGCAYHALPLFEDITAGISHEQGAEEHLIPDLGRLYARLVRECADAFRQVLMTVMTHDFDSGAVLWHCTEGKDRCGMITAMVLELLGVDRQDIMTDYLKTNEVNLPKAAIAREHARRQGEAFADSVYQAYIADERYLRSAWQAMGDTYFQEKIRIPAETLEQFKRMILI